MKLMLPSLKKAAKRKGPQDLVALDFGTSGLKAVRIRKINGVPTVMGLDILPPVAIDTLAESTGPNRIGLPRTLVANYAAVSFSAEQSVVRVVSLPGHLDNLVDAEKQIREHVGIDAQYRVHFVPASPAPAKQKGETKLLTVAIPEASVQALLGTLSMGPPAACSLEVSGLASLNACLMGPLSESSSEALCMIDCGARSSMMVIFNKGVLILARKLDVGGDHVISVLQKQLGVDRDMAQSILAGGAFDITQSIKQVMDPFLRQMTISRDFVERQENCRISSAFISGGMSLSQPWLHQIAQATGLDVRTWDPFSALSVPPGVYPDKLRGQQPRFAACVGTALGVLADS